MTDLARSQEQQPAPEPGSLREGGLRVWFAVVGPIGAWMFHLVFLASISRYSCRSHWATWAQHAVTLAMAALTVLAIWICVGLVRQGKDDDAAATREGRARFLGYFGLINGVANLALIALEGSYVLFIHRCG
jgi:hypothetical protein